MQPTRPAVLAALAGAAGCVAFLLATAAYDTLPALPRSWPLTLLALAIVELVLARSVQARRDQPRPGTAPMPALTVARAAVLARASSAAAALLGGGYVGFGLFTLGSLEKPAYARDALTCLLGLGSAAMLGGAALWLERVCRVTRPPEETNDEPSAGLPA